MGDTHITGRHFGGDTHITSDMCAGIHISRGYTYHCDSGSVTRKNGEVVLLFSILYQQFTNAKSLRGIDQVLSFAPSP